MPPKKPNGSNAVNNMDPEQLKEIVKAAIEKGSIDPKTFTPRFNVSLDFYMDLYNLKSRFH